MNLTRQEFAKSSLTAPGTPMFAAPAGWKAKGRKPNLVFGILSDTHLMVGGDGKSPHPNFPLRYIHNAMKLFKSRNIDAFVHLGDAAHRGCVREWEFHKELARLFKSVYFEGCNVAPGHESNNGITEVEIPVAELPSGKKLTVAVRPVSSLGTKGKAIAATN